MSLTPCSLFFTRLTNASTSPPSALISSSIVSTASLAPPCSGPNRALMPADTEANMLACAEPTMRTVEVEQFCSSSACSTEQQVERTHHHGRARTARRGTRTSCTGSSRPGRGCSRGRASAGRRSSCTRRRRSSGSWRAAARSTARPAPRRTGRGCPGRTSKARNGARQDRHRVRIARNRRRTP